MHKMSRRAFVRDATTAAGLFGLGLAGPSDIRAKGQPVLRIGYLPITDATPLLIAYAQGYFKDEGLAVEPPIKLRSWAALAESFLSGKCNVAHLLFPIPIWMRYNLKVPVKVLAWNHTNGSAITVAPGSGIQSIAHLGGRHIAVPFWYSIHNVIMQMGLKKAGLTPVVQSQSQSLKPNETNLFVLPPQEMPTALAGRKIDGYIVAEPYNALGELKRGARILRFTGDMWKNHPCCVVVMMQDIIKEDPIFTQKVITSLVRAHQWINEHPRQTARMLSREGEGYLPMPAEVLEQVFLRYDLATYGGRAGKPAAIRHPSWNIGRIGFQPYPYPSATRLLVAEMGQTLMEGDTGFLRKLDPDFVTSDLVEDSFVKAAVHQMGGLEKFGHLEWNTKWGREEVTDFDPFGGEAFQPAQP